MKVISDDFIDSANARLSQLGWTRKRLADEMGVTRNNVDVYFQRRSKPGPEVMERIAEALGMRLKIVLEPMPRDMVAQ